MKIFQFFIFILFSIIKRVCLVNPNEIKDKLQCCMNIVKEFSEKEKEQINSLISYAMEYNEEWGEPESEEKIGAMLLTNCYENIKQDNIKEILPKVKAKKPIGYKNYKDLYKIEEVSSIIKNKDGNQMKNYDSRIEKMKADANSVQPESSEDNIPLYARRGDIGIMGMKIKSLSKKKKNLIGFGFMLLIIIGFSFLGYKIKKMGKKDKKKKKSK